jgi:hypothetical protein
VKITIDNLDGAGVLDYTGLLSGTSPLTIERKLNEPSQCVVTLAQGALPVPASGARVAVEADNGVMLFTGYALAAPARVYGGMGTMGPQYLLELACRSEETVLDARVVGKTTECVPSSAGALLTKMMARTGTAGLPISGDALSTVIGGFQPEVGKGWSANVSALSNAARARYRVLNGEVLFETIGGQVHVLAESDGSLDRGAFHGARVRNAVGDVTVCGPVEPQAYVTELFEGDGVTAAFDLSEAPLQEKAKLVVETFRGPGVDPQAWAVVDGGGHVSVTNRGLTLGPGQGGSGASSVTALDDVEMGGVLLLELGGLEIDSPGEGYFAGFLSGSLSAANLVAAFHLQPSGTSVTATPVVLGVQAGASAALQTNHTYTLRVRYHCKDRQRALQSYSTGGADGAVVLGGGTLTAGADLVLEIQETTGGAQFAPVVLYDGSIQQAPASCTPMVVDSINFLGSMASFELTRPGEVWVSCAPAGSAAATQRLGPSAQSAQAKVTSTGRLTFYKGNVPGTGTVVSVAYRVGGYALARMAAASGATLGSLIVRAEHPRTRTSADCELAALALLATSTWSDGAWKGTYDCWNAHLRADMWPGDLLQVEAASAAVNAALLIRAVQVKATSCAPELLQYKVTYANEWAEVFSLKTTEGAPATAWLPSTALVAPTALASLGDLVVAGVSATQIQVQAGMAPPAGGGFEVRRSDETFGAGDGADLVLRSPVANFTIVREAPVERYYVRMYDGATPPNYSRYSSAIFVNIAMQ